ncbi:MAG TPA: amino acid ABC transporter permease [Xanthobacteraceae bacterium]|nr:amino acid ABC transporter permease [Xanthobacteraceae bacterium]
MADIAERAPPERGSLLTNPLARSILIQAALLVLVIGAGLYFFENARANLAAQHIATGFGFLNGTAGFGVSQALIPYSETSTYGRAFVVGLLNTLLVAGLGIVFATILGFLIGIARLSKNWLLAKLAAVYVEVIRNQPLLFQILFWYLAVLATLPPPRQSFSFLGLVFANNRGLVVPEPIFNEGSGTVGIAFLVGLVAAIVIRYWARARQMRTGQVFPTGRVALALIFGLPLLTYIVLGAPIRFDLPELKGLNFATGLRIIPELIALLLALSTYTAAFIAEIVRAGILAVNKGQTEAAYSLGLSPSLALRLVVVPQALRVIIPPLTSQYLNLTKNSSLAVAIGYPDFFALFAGTTLNQTGQAIEIIAVTMAVYLAISLITSGLMNFYNRRVALVER